MAKCIHMEPVLKSQSAVTAMAFDRQIAQALAVMAVTPR
jgi:hypothetical protein